MNNTDINEEVEKLVNFIQFFNFDLGQERRIIHKNHIGAIITEAVLQSGLNYKFVVKPRIDSILQKYPKHKTISSMLQLIEQVGVDNLLNWKGQSKIDRFMDLILFCKSRGIEDTLDFKNWIINTDNEKLLLNIKGIGPKTIDYFKLLLGIPSIPIDRHLFKFADLSGVKSKKYSDISMIYKRASSELNVEYHILDSVIWNFMNVLSI